MIYELREYVAHGHALEKVHERFATTTLALFERHGLDVAGFWTDRADPARILYLLRFPDAAAKDAAWARFQSDEEWQQAKASSEADGPIVAEMTSRTLEPVSYWPPETTTPRGDQS